MKTRPIKKINASPFHPGFLGEGHRASAVIDGNNFSETDPFILLMDDQLDLPGGQPVGGAHPHAGFETVTLVLEGNGHDWKTGSLELMTAGKGIVHTEEITEKQKLRILQLWLVLPPDKRWTAPRWQKIELEEVPSIKNAHAEIHVYSGTSQGLTSPLQNYTPFTLVDFKMNKHSEITHELPLAYTGFIYVLDGNIWVGDKNIKQEHSAWFSPSTESEIIFRTEDDNARFVLYAGQPQHASIVQHGPFVGDSQEDIKRLFKEYRQGIIPHLNDIPQEMKIQYQSVH